MLKVCGIPHTASVPLDLTDEEHAALLRLLHAEPHEVDDSDRAVVVAVERRHTNTVDGRLAIQAARRNGRSWRYLNRLTGIAVSTLRDWGKPIPGEGQDEPSPDEGEDDE